MSSTQNHKTVCLDLPQRCGGTAGDATAQRVESGDNSNKWRLNRQVNLSVLVQIVFLASLIVGSWMNLQRQLDLVQKDIEMLLTCNKEFQQKLEALWSKSIEYEYRLQNIEKITSNSKF